VYEVTSLVDGVLIDADRHLERLDRSLHAIGMESPMPHRVWVDVMNETASRANVRDGFVYIEVTRGPADRDFAFPREVHPTLFAFARAKDFRNDPLARGAALATVPDLRWVRRDIKSVSLLAQVLAKQAAREQGAHDALMHEDGVVTEGGSSTAWIVQKGTLITRSLSFDILAGVTRSVAMEIAPAEDIAVLERAFTLEEAYAADEVFITSATGFVIPIIRIDQHVIAAGAPGPIALRIRERYLERAYANARRGRSA
jgi:D-alanine transaminase